MAISIPSGKSQTLAADGNTDWVEIVGPAWVSISNNFGTGTAKIQFKDTGGTAVDVTDGSFTTVADKVVDFPAFATNQLRVNLASSSSPDLDIVIQGTSPYDKEPGKY